MSDSVNPPIPASSGPTTLGQRLAIAPPPDAPPEMIARWCDACCREVDACEDPAVLAQAILRSRDYCGQLPRNAPEHGAPVRLQLRSIRTLGVWLVQHNQRGGDRRGATGGDRRNLTSIGLTHKTTSQCRRLASIPADRFEAKLANNSGDLLSIAVLLAAGTPEPSCTGQRAPLTLHLDRDALASASPTRESPTRGSSPPIKPCPEPPWLEPLGMLLQTIESFALSIQEHRQQRRPEKGPQRGDPMSGHELDSQMLVYFADQVREALQSEPEDRSV